MTDEAYDFARERPLFYTYDSDELVFYTRSGLRHGTKNDAGYKGDTKPDNRKAYDSWQADRRAITRS